MDKLEYNFLNQVHLLVLGMACLQVLDYETKNGLFLYHYLAIKFLTQNLDFLLDVPVKLTAELGNCKMTMQELLNLDLGSVVQLDKPANANVDVYVNQKLVARGEVVVAEDNFGIRIKEIIAKS